MAALTKVELTRPDPRDPSTPDAFSSRSMVAVGVGTHQGRVGRQGTSRAELGRRGPRVESLHGLRGESTRRPYMLRNTFRTIGDEVKDQPASMLVMGHADQSISGYYRETVSDDRLRAVTDHVRSWLLAGRGKHENGLR